MVTAQSIDEAKLQAFVGRGVNDFGALISATLVALGDRLGLYRAMAGAGALSPDELASRTGTSVHMVRAWLINQGASSYVDYDPATGKYRLPDEHAIALTDESSPYFLAGAFQASLAVAKDEAKISDAFRTGKGVLWGEHDAGLFLGTERLFAPNYVNFLVQTWIPALDDVEAKLSTGVRVADVGCGHGISTLVMAKAYPRSQFTGFDNHAPSVATASARAQEAGVKERLTFQVADAQSYPGPAYDLIAFFDCLHDVGDPVGALRHARESLTPDGTVMLVEPMAGQQVEENFNPVGRAFSAFSVLVCTPNALASSDGKQALGTVATDEALRQVATAAGFTHFRRATETPFNRIFELRV